ncbi:MAG: lactate racemase domain-containing protein [Clostridia bacterium]|nr:lactate racemase domain-containing protein [Clostridia bacterium]
MSILEQLVSEIKIPKMVKVRQNFPRPVIRDIAKTIRAQVERAEIAGRIKTGDKVAITIGSRGIENLLTITKAVVGILKERGAKPFIIPTMGSHGGATAKGQVEVLKNLGITEDTVGAPIRSTMEVVVLGTTESGVPVYFDRYTATELDATIVMGRIKPHTSFRGSYESGLAKMIVIGLGKQKGAEICHATRLTNMSGRIEEMARVAIDKANIAFAIGIIENAYDETSKIVALPKEKIMDEEPVLLVEARANLPQILFERCHVLIVDEIGKNISGTGMDPNIVKRFTSDAIQCKPLTQRIVALDLTKETHGNANGIGLADICTERLYNKMDFYKTYPNPLTSRVLLSAKIPMVMDSDSQAIRAAIKTCLDVDYNNIRMIRIKNTMKLDEIYISENMTDEADKNPNIEILDHPMPMTFDEKGNLF